MVMRATGYSYSSAATTSNSDIQAHLGSHFSSFEQNGEIYNLSNGMEVIGFSSPKNLYKQQSFFDKPPGYDHVAGPSSSASKAINEPSSTSDQFYHQQHEQSSTSDQFLLLDDSSLRCTFPLDDTFRTLLRNRSCEGVEKPISQGLSLSLSSSNDPSSIVFHDHDMMRSFVASSSRDGFFNKHFMNIQSQKQMMQDGFLLGKAANNLQFEIGSSKYLVPARELLTEFCNLGTYKPKDHSSEKKLQKANQWQDHEKASSSSLSSLDLLELQKRKTKLLQMLQEVDTRYKHYCNQMKAVVSSFDSIVGNGAATVYSALPSKVMSRHFKRLRDGIVGQIKATKKAMVEKESSVAPGTKRGETPRLRILDQTLRQQKALQQMSMMESHPWRPVRGLPERSVSLLRAWLFEHFLHPYPSDMDKHILARQTGLSRSQVSNWFINARVRLWKPMVEEMYLKETKEQQNAENSIDGNGELARLDDENGGTDQNNHQNNNPDQKHLEDQKPTLDQLTRIDSECLSSIINNNQEKNVGKNSKIRSVQDHQLQYHDFGSLGGMELDFSSCNHNSYGGVSLTLGLHQHAGATGVSLAFPPAAPHQSSLFYPRDHIGDCQPVQYSPLDNNGQNLHHRNLMSGQFLHDLAG